MLACVLSVSGFFLSSSTVAYLHYSKKNYFLVIILSIIVNHLGFLIAAKKYVER